MTGQTLPINNVARRYRTPWRAESVQYPKSSKDMLAVVRRLGFRGRKAETCVTFAPGFPVLVFRIEPNSRLYEGDEGFRDAGEKFSSFVAASVTCAKIQPHFSMISIAVFMEKSGTAPSYVLSPQSQDEI